MTPKKIFFLCDVCDIDIVEKSFAETKDYEVTIETSERILEYGVKDYLQRTIELINQHPDMYDGVVGTHDSSAVFAAIICDQTGKTFASVESLINCQNKYLCRQIQKECIPENVPRFALALDYLRNPELLSSPVFIKPVRSNISFGTHIIHTPDELEKYIGQETQDIIYFNQYYLDALSLSAQYYNPSNLETCNNYLCEEFISGDQVTVDGFVVDGQVQFIGMTKAVYYEHTNSFSHHEFPYAFSSELESFIKANLTKLIFCLGIDNSFFNIELRANEAKNTFTIIEVNSRIAFQFAKTIQTVKGYDPLHLLCDIAAGSEPSLHPRTNQELFDLCFDFELHAFSDQRILKTPTQSGFEEVKLYYPEIYIRNLIHENTCLSDYKHNPESFRYCIMDIPGNTREEIMNKYHHVISMLKYEFEDISK
jgi:hypothetical protein